MFIWRSDHHGFYGFVLSWWARDGVLWTKDRALLGLRCPKIPSTYIWLFMSKLTRFSVSIDDEILALFDKDIEERHYPTRSKAISDLITKGFHRSNWGKGTQSVGIISIVYDHHKSQVVNKLIEIQHDSSVEISASQHIHLSHSNCLEVIVAKGKPAELEDLAHRLGGIKGVSFCEISGVTLD